MVLDKKQTTIAYRCPHCGAGVMSIIDIFKLSAPMVKLKCQCGKSEMSIIKQNDGKIRLSVPCILCPKPHNYLVNEKIFFSNEEFFLQCPYSDMDICFLGDLDYVKANLARNELDLLEMMEKAGISDLSAIRQANEIDEDEAQDSEIALNIIFVLRELEADNKIYCRCEHKDEIDEDKYLIDTRADGVHITCRDCGASRVIPAENSMSTHAFLDSEALYLE